MAKILRIGETTIEAWARVAGLGLVFGVVLWLVSLGLSHFVIEPLSCGISGNATKCSESLDIASGVASVLLAVGVMFAGIWLRIARPAIVAVSAAIMLWGLASWLSGLFWLEALGWSALVGVIVFLLFGWINRTQSIALTVILTVVILVAEHIALSV